MPNPVSPNHLWVKGTETELQIRPVVEVAKLDVGPATMPPAYVAEALKYQETIDQLRKDRDELAVALDKAVAFHWEDPDYDTEAHQDHCRALIARIKGGG